MLGKLPAHLLHRSTTLDEHLVGHAQLLGDGQHLVVVVVTLVNVHRDTILTHLQSLPQRRDLQARNGDTVTTFQVELLQLGIGVFADRAATGGRSVECAIVAEHEDAVARHL